MTNLRRFSFKIKEMSGLRRRGKPASLHMEFLSGNSPLKYNKKNKKCSPRPGRSPHMLSTVSVWPKSDLVGPDYAVPEVHTGTDALPGPVQSALPVLLIEGSLLGGNSTAYSTGF